MYLVVVMYATAMVTAGEVMNLMSKNHFMPREARYLSYNTCNRK